MGEIVVTGVGVISPLGVGKEDFWKGLAEGHNGVREIVEFDTIPFRSKKAGLVSEFNPKTFIPPMKIRRLDRASQFAIAASKMALEDAGLKVGQDIPAERTGIILGSGFCGLANSEEFHRGQVQRGPGDLNPMLFPNTVPNAAASNASIELGIRGPNSTVVQSFCTAEAAFFFACQQLIARRAEVVLTGGVDELSPILYRGWNELHLTAWDRGEGERNVPYDLRRNGFIPGEGAGILVLERREDALERKARIYGQILGCVATAGVSDPGDKVARSIVSTLQRGEMETIDFIDGAGNSSPRLDVVEARGIRLAFPNHYLDIPVSSIKSMVGEGIASGGIRMAADLLIIEREIIPPTINYEYPDPHCALRIVQLPQKASVRTILHTGISLDGTYVSVLLGRADGIP